MIKILILYFVLINLILFALMGADKSKSRRGKWRVPERRLFVLAVLGGAVGGTLGMFLFRHKTRHWYFRFGFPLLAMLQLSALAYFSAGGFGMFRLPLAQ